MRMNMRTLSAAVFAATLFIAAAGCKKKVAAAPPPPPPRRLRPPPPPPPKAQPPRIDTFAAEPDPSSAANRRPCVGPWRTPPTCRSIRAWAQCRPMGHGKYPGQFDHLHADGEWSRRHGHALGHGDGERSSTAAAAAQAPAAEGDHLERRSPEPRGAGYLLRLRL